MKGKGGRGRVLRRAEEEACTDKGPRGSSRWLSLGPRADACGEGSCLFPAGSRGLSG